MELEKTWFSILFVLIEEEAQKIQGWREGTTVCRFVAQLKVLKHGFSTPRLFADCIVIMELEMFEEEIVRLSGIIQTAWSGQLNGVE